MMILVFLFMVFPAYSAPNADQELRSGMYTLGGWSAANLTVSALPAWSETDQQWRAYHQMNVAWNTVNLSLAGFALHRSNKAKPASLAKIFWVNCALDVLYVTGGMLLRERGIRNSDLQSHGWGESIMVQGSFLLVFDGWMGWRMHRAARQSRVTP